MFHHLFLGVQTESNTVKALLATDLSYLKTVNMWQENPTYSIATLKTERRFVYRCAVTQLRRSSKNKVILLSPGTSMD